MLVSANDSNDAHTVHFHLDILQTDATLDRAEIRKLFATQRRRLVLLKLAYVLSDQSRHDEFNPGFNFRCEICWLHAPGLFVSRGKQANLEFEYFGLSSRAVRV
jgi:hypothetical protein